MSPVGEVLPQINQDKLSIRTTPENRKNSLPVYLQDSPIQFVAGSPKSRKWWTHSRDEEDLASPSIQEMGATSRRGSAPTIPTHALLQDHKASPSNNGQPNGMFRKGSLDPSLMLPSIHNTSRRGSHDSLEPQSPTTPSSTSFSRHNEKSWGKKAPVPAFDLSYATTATSVTSNDDDSSDYNEDFRVSRNPASTLPHLVSTSELEDCNFSIPKLRSYEDDGNSGSQSLSSSPQSSPSRSRMRAPRRSYSQDGLDTMTTFPKSRLARESKDTKPQTADRKIRRGSIDSLRESKLGKTKRGALQGLDMKRHETERLRDMYKRLVILSNNANQTVTMSVLEMELLPGSSKEFGDRLCSLREFIGDYNNITFESFLTLWFLDMPMEELEMLACGSDANKN